MADPAVLWSYLFAAQPVLRVTISATAEDLTIATGTTAPKTITEIAALLQTALNGHTAGPTLTVSITSGFRLQIVSDLAVQLNFSHANTTIDPVILGFTSADTASCAPETTVGNGSSWTASLLITSMVEEHALYVRIQNSFSPAVTVPPTMVSDAWSSKGVP